MASISAFSELRASATPAGARLLQRAARLAASARETALDLIAVLRATDQANLPASSSVAIDRPPDEVYAYVRRLSNLPRFIDYLHAVREADDTYSHWITRPTPDRAIAWDVKITDDRPGVALAWRSVQGSLVDARGMMTFADAPGGGTRVRFEVQLASAPRADGDAARWFTRTQLDGDLWRLKRILEAGRGRS